MKYSIHCFNLLITFSPIFYSRSDPTENDSVEGLRPNARGPGLVTFGVSATLKLFQTTTFEVFWSFMLH